MLNAPRIIPIKPLTSFSLYRSRFLNFKIFNQRTLSSSSGSSKTSKAKEYKKKKVDLSKFPPEYIRNFGIIAHVDHGKSTLSDRLLEFTGTISSTEQNDQFLDKLPVERQRGITVKAQSSAMVYQYKGQTYLMNLIDTPGHVDFNYEVLRSLSVCGGVLLLIDANQGIQAQTIANYNLAFMGEIPLIPVLNKIDLQRAQPEKVAAQVERVLGIKKEEIPMISAKLGTGVETLIEKIIEKLPSPKGSPDAPFRAYLFDSWHDKARGVVVLLHIVDGSLQTGDTITSHLTGKSFIIKELGILHPNETPAPKLYTGQVGYVVLNLKDIQEAKLGDTFFLASQSSNPPKALPLIERSKPMVFAGLYPMSPSQLKSLESAIHKLVLNDPSVHISIESSPALGQGWRLGFLGLLHMEVFSQRLEMEHDEEVINTAPSVPYKVKIKGEKNIKFYGSDILTITNPLKLPDRTIIEEYYEPMVYGTIVTPSDYISKIYSLCRERRGVGVNTTFIDQNTTMLQYKFPLSEVIIDFYDKLKSVTSGYASFDYEDAGYEKADLIKLEITLNNQLVEELTSLVPADRAQSFGKTMCERLKEAIPAQLYKVTIRAIYGKHVLAKETLRPLAKDVTAKLYGGDVTRRMKLLSYQAAGKNRMRMIGKVPVPRDAFIKVLQR